MFNLGIYFETKILGVSQFQSSKINLFKIENTNKAVVHPKNFSVELISLKAVFKENSILCKIENSLIKSMKNDNLDFAVNNVPSGDQDICHQPFYRLALPLKNRLTTTTVTHIDSSLKKLFLKWLIKNNVSPIFMSYESANLFKLNRSKESECFVVVPPPQFSEVKRKIKLGFFSNIYPDGRKREDTLIKALSKTSDCSLFELYVMGEGTKSLVNNLFKLGCDAHHLDNFNISYYAEYLKTIDHNIYTGFDEVAISTLDALNAGIPVIVPKSGGNLELGPMGVTLFQNSDDLTVILE
jgi:glycosyltransferase involved in cell wall biosynthesis